jgi:hypothetical protein
MSRLLSDPIAIEVKSFNGRIPEHFQRNGIEHQVQNVADHWRVNTGWWKVQITRDYFELQTSGSLFATIYHDLIADRWYLQRIYD